MRAHGLGAHIRVETGDDNSHLARLRSLWLTSVDGAGYEVGRRAADVLLARIHEPRREAELHLLTPTLQARGTTAPPPG